IPESEEDKEDLLNGHVREDLASPSSTTTNAESMDLGQETPENSRSNSVASQHGLDGEDGSSSSHHGAEDYQYQEAMDLMSPTQEDKHVGGRMMFENSMLSPTGFQLRRSQSTSSNSPTSIKFPLNNNLGETDNFQEDYEIHMFVK
ncbi:hypothetical protein N309_04228, partial [Tinamus guttatus]